MEGSEDRAQSLNLAADCRWPLKHVFSKAHLATMGLVPLGFAGTMLICLTAGAYGFPTRYLIRPREGLGLLKFRDPSTAPTSPGTMNTEIDHCRSTWQCLSAPKRFSWPRLCWELFPLKQMRNLYGALSFVPSHEKPCKDTLKKPLNQDLDIFSLHGSLLESLKKGTT